MYLTKKKTNENNSRRFLMDWESDLKGNYHGNVRSEFVKCQNIVNIQRDAILDQITIYPEQRQHDFAMRTRTWV